MIVSKLEKSWDFKQSDTDQWMPVDRVPTNVHLDLIANKKIPDPYIGFNELDCQWVAEKSWTYRTRLPVAASAQAGQVHVLALDGLDTFATVKLNGEVVLRSDNMFIPRRTNVTSIIKEGEPILLEIEFASALLEARKIKDAHPEHKWVGFNGEMARLAVRKAQYHW